MDMRNIRRAPARGICVLPVDSYPENAGEMWISPSKIAEAKLFNRKRKELVISGDETVNLGKGNTTGKTIIAWNLRLTRGK
jgi:hypothetical protein